MRATSASEHRRCENGKSPVSGGASANLMTFLREIDAWGESCKSYMEWLPNSVRAGGARVAGKRDSLPKHVLRSDSLRHLPANTLASQSQTGRTHSRLPRGQTFSRCLMC